MYFELQISTQKYQLFIKILFIIGHYADLMVPIGHNSFEDNFKMGKNSFHHCSLKELTDVQRFTHFHEKVKNNALHHF